MPHSKWRRGFLQDLQTNRVVLVDRCSQWLKEGNPTKVLPEVEVVEKLGYLAMVKNYLRKIGKEGK